MMQPHSPAAEQATLGIILSNNDLYSIVDERLQAGDFYVPLYADVYTAIGELIKSGMVANPISVAEKLEGKHGTNAELLAHFTEMYEMAGLNGSISTSAYLVAEHAYQRRLIAAATELSKAATENRVEDAKAWQAALAELTTSFSNQNVETPLLQIKRAFHAAKKHNNMMLTGIHGWDSLFYGLFKGSRYIIAGQGGAGKSALAINIAWNMAKSGKRVRWLSYEEEPDAIWWRIMSREANEAYTSFRKGLTERQEANVATVQNNILGHDFLSFFNVPDLGSMINACGECDLIVLDGITSAPAQGAANKIEKAGIVTEYCAKLAAKTGAAIIMLAHINSESAKNGASMTGIYGGQAATFDPEGIVDLRWFDDEHKTIKMTVLKNRYGASGKDALLNFNYERMEVL